MEHIIISLNVVLPVFAIISLGYLLRYKKVIDENFISKAMKVIFNVCLPGMLFSKVSKSEVTSIIHMDSLRFIIYVFVSTIVIFIIGKMIANILVQDQGSRGAFVQGAFRSNYVIIGYSVLDSLFGDAITGRMALLVIAIVPLYNILSIWVLSEDNGAGSLKEVGIKIIKNPLIIGIMLGFIVAITGIKVPAFLNNTINMLGAVGTPLGLLGIGAYFTLDQLKDIKSSILAVGLKVIIFPTIVTTVAYLFGFDYMDITLIFVLFGSPTAISSFIMATALEGDSQLAANIVIISTAVSLFTLISGLTLIGALVAG